MRLKCVVAGTGLLLAALGLGTITLAQEDPVVPASGDEDGKNKTPIALYFEVATGSMTADDISTGVRTLTTRYTEASLSLEDQTFARVAVGWKLANDRGDFRFRFDGYKEDGYKLHSTGRLAAVAPGLDVPNSVSAAVDWWDVEVVDGNMFAVRTPPVWEQALDDVNGNEIIDPDEVRYVGADRIQSSGLATDLQNRLQTYDLLYGREFGTRRMSARWWAGLRYLVYDGNLLGTAWLLSTTDTGFTDNVLLPLLSFSQETTGIGPTGVMETDFKFLDERLMVFFRGQAAFMVSDLSVDSGDIATLVSDSSSNLLPVPARLAETRNKSTWNTAAELGVRYNLRSGLQIEAAYSLTGYLDTILLPDDIQIPETPQESRQGTSALYSTQDITFDGWRVGAAFQF